MRSASTRPNRGPPGRRAVRAAGETAAPPLTSTFWVLLALVTFITYLRPQNTLLPLIGTLRIPMLAVVALGVYWAFTLKMDGGQNKVVVYWSLWVLLTLCGVIYGVNQYWPVESARTLIIYLFGTCLPILALHRRQEDIEKFLDIWLACNALTGLYAIFHSGHGTGGFLSDENDLALAMAVALPFAIVRASVPSERRLIKLLRVASAGVILLGIITSMSRGGFLAFVTAMVVLSVYRQTRPLIVRFAVIGCVILVAASSAYWKEVDSIFAPGAGTDRRYSWAVAWVMFKENPILGVGAANYPWTVQTYETSMGVQRPVGGTLGGRVAHSTPMTILSETGLVGSTLMASMLIATVRPTMRRAKAAAHSPSPAADQYGRLCAAGVASLAAFIIGCIFLTAVYYAHIWVITALLAALASLPQPDAPLTADRKSR